MNPRPRLLLLLLLAFLVAHAPVSAQPSTVSFQGELTAQGARFDGISAFKFVLLCGATSAWSNDGSSTNGSEPGSSIPVPVQDGVFAILLGDVSLGMVAIDADALGSCEEPALRTWVDTGSGFTQLGDQPLSSAPFALQAMNAKRAPTGFTVTGLLEVRNAQGESVIAADGESGELTLTSLRFADGTVQTTAGAGGPVSDGDWTINGTNLYSTVSGNVGIGLSTPTEKLHVRTPTSVPARIALRSGGSWNLLFEQDPESVFSISNGGQKRLAIQPNGNIGIGTTTPGTKLDIAGSTLVQGDLTVQGSLEVNGVAFGSGVISIPPNAFQPDDHLQTFKRAGLYYYGETAGQGVTIEAPVHLPHGATITEYTVFLTDNYSPVVTGSNIQTFLLRTPVNGSTGQILANRSTTGAPGRVTLTQTGIGHVVDNVNNFYYVAANWVTPASGGVSQLRHHGVVIRYTTN